MEYPPAEATRALAISSAGGSDFPDRLKAASRTGVKFRVLRRSSAPTAAMVLLIPAAEEELWNSLKAALCDRLNKARKW